jgi:hypothetical protein
MEDGYRYFLLVWNMIQYLQVSLNHVPGTVMLVSLDYSKGKVAKHKPLALATKKNTSFYCLPTWTTLL